jgi:hypothetical protein
MLIIFFVTNFTTWRNWRRPDHWPDEEPQVEEPQVEDSSDEEEELTHDYSDEEEEKT